VQWKKNHNASNIESLYRLLWQRKDRTVYPKKYPKEKRPKHVTLKTQIISCFLFFLVSRRLITYMYLENAPLPFWVDLSIRTVIISMVLKLDIFHCRSTLYFITTKRMEVKKNNKRRQFLKTINHQLNFKKAIKLFK